jgi:hypothetical protein
VQVARFPIKVMFLERVLHSMRVYIGAWRDPASVSCRALLHCMSTWRASTFVRLGSNFTHSSCVVVVENPTDLRALWGTDHQSSWASHIILSPPTPMHWHSMLVFANSQIETHFQNKLHTCFTTHRIRVGWEWRGRRHCFSLSRFGTGRAREAQFQSRPAYQLDLSGSTVQLCC